MDFLEACTILLHVRLELESSEPTAGIGIASHVGTTSDSRQIVGLIIDFIASGHWSSP